VNDAYASRNQLSIKEYQDKAQNGYNYSVVEMTYDANGNLIKDLDRDIVTIRYNLLNLPDTIQFKNGNQIRNFYDASGKKLRTEFSTLGSQVVIPVGSIGSPGSPNDCYDNLSGTDYVNNVEYVFSNDCGDYQFDLDKIYNSEGYVTAVFNPQYHYYRRDHLGNNREVWLANNNTTVQRTQYYPSGLPWPSNTGDNPGLQNKKYNGKEFVEMHGYDTYDIVWRQYYPAIGRFQTPDPEIEDAYNESPYAMCDNNMVNRTDPDGRFWNYVGGGIAGGLMELGTQVVANAITGEDQKINWKKVGVGALEGAVTSGGSVALKVSATVVAAYAQSALDGNTGFKNLTKGALVNLGSGAAGSGASKLAKGVGERGLEKVANKMVGSKTAITKSVQNLTNTSTKTARGVAKTVQNAEKAAAKEVKKSVQTTTKAAVTESSKKYYEGKK